MAVRIVHFGSNNLNRIAALKHRGYKVEECKSLDQLHASLIGISPTDAVVIAENDGATPDHAISLIRAISAAPLILFGDSNEDYKRNEFDLVIPHDAGGDNWLIEIAELIVRSAQRNR